MGSVAVILSILTQALAVIPEGTALYQQFTAQKAQAQQWAASNYVPTDADWAALDAKTASDEAAIDAGAK
jgi:hypothetical protein